MSMVKIVSITQPLIDDEDGEKLTIEEFIAYCARVSNPSNQMNTKTASKLLQYCADNKHWSIFEMANVTMEVVTTRDIAHQIIRHRSYAFQEFSQRYADPTKELKFTIREARLQDSKNRQNSIEINDEHLQQEWEIKQRQVIMAANEAYQWAIDMGLAKEVARSVLPEGLTETKLYMNGTVRSWIHFIQVRTDPSTQKEHREIALLCADELTKIIPMIHGFVSKQ